MNDFETPIEPKKSAASQASPEEKLPNEPTNVPEFKKEELIAIFDSLLFSGEYTESVTINKRLKATFRTRTVKEINDINNKLDSATINLVTTANDLRSAENLKYALVSLQGRDLSKLSMEERNKVVDGLPSPIMALLITELSKFDRKVFAACVEGEANF